MSEIIVSSTVYDVTTVDASDTFVDRLKVAGT
jgi:hypothetical protein